MIQFLLILIGVLVLVILVLLVMRHFAKKKTQAIEKSLSEIREENRILEERVHKDLQYMQAMEVLKKKTTKNKILIEEAENEAEVSNNFDDAINDLNQLRLKRENHN